MSPSEILEAVPAALGVVFARDAVTTSVSLQLLDDELAKCPEVTAASPNQRALCLAQAIRNRLALLAEQQVMEARQTRDGGQAPSGGRGGRPGGLTAEILAALVALAKNPTSKLHAVESRPWTAEDDPHQVLAALVGTGSFNAITVARAGGSLAPSTPGIIKHAAKLRASEKQFFRRAALVGEATPWDDVSGAPIDADTPTAAAFGAIDGEAVVDGLIANCVALEFSKLTPPQLVTLVAAVCGARQVQPPQVGASIAAPSNGWDDLLSVLGPLLRLCGIDPTSLERVVGRIKGYEVQEFTDPHATRTELNAVMSTYLEDVTEAANNAKLGAVTGLLQVPPNGPADKKLDVMFELAATARDGGGGGGGVGGPRPSPRPAGGGFQGVIRARALRKGALSGVAGRSWPAQCHWGLPGHASDG
jgi:hypothetical protein